MSLFEWIGERFNPGPIGKIDGPDDENSYQPKNKFWIWFLTILGACLFGFLLWNIFQSENPPLLLLFLLLYLLLAYFLSPKPDRSNMGWLGGLMDNPFRISDDINRFLFFLALFLLPGKIMLYALQTIINTIKALSVFG